jgi:polysaccharide biosynthesis transport protein
MMLQMNKATLSPPVAASERPKEQPKDFASPSELFHGFLGLLRRQFPVVIFILLLAIGLASAYLYTAPRIYTAQAKLVIDSRKILPQQQTMGGDIALDAAQVESQVEILKSENIADAVVKELHLADDPEFTGVAKRGLLSTVFEFFGLLGSSDEGPHSETELIRNAAGTLLDNLSVRRVGFSYVIEISYRSLNPSRAAQVANAVADAYVVDQLESKYQATRRASIWLQDRIKDLKAQASATEQAVLDFKQKHNIVDTGGRLMGVQQLSELNSQLVTLRGQTAEAKARYDRIEEVLKQEVPDASVADALKSEIINRLRGQYLDLSAKEATWATRYGKDHLATVGLRNQLREIQRSIKTELQRIAEANKSDYEIAKAREQAITDILSTAVTTSQSVSQAQVGLRELESNAQTARAMYDNFLQRYMEAVQQQSFPISEARLISRATAPSSPSAPKKSMVMFAALLGGFVVSFGVAWLRDIWDRVFRTAEQVEAELNTECLAVLPILKPEAKPRALARGAVNEAAPRHGAAAERTFVGTAILRQAIEEPFSPFAEALRHIKLAVDLGGVVRSNKVIGVTSTFAHEGKTMVSSNLAKLISLSGPRVLLMDGDLRNPELTRELTPKASSGLIEALSGRESMDDVLWYGSGTNLAFLPTVATARLPHTSEILGSDPLKSLFESLREKFDYIIVDLSPLGPVVDVRATTNFIDSYVYVIEWGKTPVEAVQRTLGNARGVSERLAGCVLNKANMRVMSRYQEYQGGYYYQGYYSRYGYRGE